MKTIRFEREEAVGHIVLANPPTNYLDRRYVSVWPARSTRPARAMSGWCWFARGGPNFSVGGDVRE